VLVRRESPQPDGRRLDGAGVVVVAHLRGDRHVAESDRRFRPLRRQLPAEEVDQGRRDQRQAPGLRQNDFLQFGVFVVDVVVSDERRIRRVPRAGVNGARQAVRHFFAGSSKQTVRAGDVTGGQNESLRRQAQKVRLPKVR